MTIWGRVHEPDEGRARGRLRPAAGGVGAAAQGSGLRGGRLCGGRASLLSAVAEHRPDVAVVDVRMPPTMTDDGLRAAVAARAAQPDLGVLMLSAYIEMSYADALLSDGRGRVGYLLKDRVTSLDRLSDALRTIAAGGTVLDPEVIAQLLVSRRSDPLGTLTPRERGVVLDGRGAQQRSHRESTRGLRRRCGREAHIEHLRQDQLA